MAQRKRTRRTKRKQSLLHDVTNALFRAEVAGIILILLSAFTLLSLLGNRGELTRAWIQWLSMLFGLGVWGFPLVTGVLGLWFVIRAIEQMPDLPWQRPAAFALLFLTYVTGITLLLRDSVGAAGGLIGGFLASLMIEALGVWAAWSVVSFSAIIGIVLLTDRLLLDAAQETARVLGAALSNGWASYQEWRAQPTIPPPLSSGQHTTVPVPSGILPWWKSVRERWFPPRTYVEPSYSPPPASNLVQPDPPATRAEPIRGAAQTQKPASATTTAATTAVAAVKPLSGAAGHGEPSLLTPRIVGGAQEWRLPSLNDTLNNWERRVDSDDMIRKQGRMIQETLALFGVPADFEGAYKGPSVTQYLIKPGYVERTIRGEAQRVKVKVSKIAGLANDLALALAAPSVRIEAPIPGTSYVGIEVPNTESNVVGIKELMESEAFQTIKAKLPIALGEDVKGQPVVADLARMPHLLIAGATGSGKSVCINAIVTCLLMTHTPDSLRFLMIDPKMVELSVYNGVPHLLSPVVTDVEQAAKVLFWAVKEMERRYQLCSKVNARDLERYNAYLTKRNEKPLPYIVVIVDEMADLMMAAPEEVEKHICRLAQMARAVGIHLIVATQRPSTDVITGLIKANFPARIAFAVSSQIDSRVILDMPGAERLLGKGDMLSMRSDASKVERLQGAFMDDEEINRVVRYWKGFRTLEGPSSAAGTAQGAQTGQADAADTETAGQVATDPSAATLEQKPVDTGAAVPAAHEDAVGSAAYSDPGPHQPDLFGTDLLAEVEEMQSRADRDVLFDEAVGIVEAAGRGSVSLLQRKLRIGYSRSSRLVDQLEEAGVLGPDLGGSQGRQVLTGQTPNQPEPSAGADQTIDDYADEYANEATRSAQSDHRRNPPTRPQRTRLPTPTTKPRIIGGTDPTETNDDEYADAPPRIWM
ncbi:MAG: DNA translocase FtsK 4TM domain-containing protein [Litorilinea sp.]